MRFSVSERQRRYDERIERSLDPGTNESSRRKVGWLPRQYLYLPVAGRRWNICLDSPFHRTWRICPLRDERCLDPPHLGSFRRKILDVQDGGFFSPKDPSIREI